MKVTDAAGKAKGLSDLPGRDTNKVQSGAPTFQSKLERADEINYEERISGLVKNIIDQGEKLGGKADIRELKIYKTLISEFLDEAVNNSHRFSKKNFLDRRGRHKVYAVIKRVNENLENITREMLSNERDNLSVLKSLDDIRGLILDLAL